MRWDDDTDDEERADVEAERRRESSPRGLIERSTVRHHNLVSKYITDEGPPQRIEKVHLLVEVLPASLEELVLCLTFSSDRKTAIQFQDLPDKKPLRLPNLSRVVFEAKKADSLDSLVQHS